MYTYSFWPDTCTTLCAQADQIEASSNFSLIYDIGAHDYPKQLLIIGASNLYNAAHEVSLCDGQPPIPVYYYVRQGGNLEELEIGLSKLCKEDYFICDSMRHHSFKTPRPLNILLFSTCNDVGRPYMDPQGKYLARMVFKMHKIIADFATMSKRKVKFALTTYMHAPHQFRFHEYVDTYNNKIREINAEVFEVATYEADNLVVKPLKTGEIGMISIDGMRYNSPDENWRSSKGHHLMGHVLMSYLHDFRLYLNDDFATKSRRPQEALEYKITVSGTPLTKKSMPEPPKWATAETHKRYNSYASAFGATSRNTNTEGIPPPPPPPGVAPRTSANLEPLGGSRENKRQANFGNTAIFKAPRQTNKQKAMIAERERLKEEAKEGAIERSSIDMDDVTDPKWAKYFGKDA